MVSPPVAAPKPSVAPGLVESPDTVSPPESPVAAAASEAAVAAPVPTAGPIPTAEYPWRRAAMPKALPTFTPGGVLNPPPPPVPPVSQWPWPVGLNRPPAPPAPPAPVKAAPEVVPPRPQVSGSKASSSKAGPKPSSRPAPYWGEFLDDKMN